MWTCRWSWTRSRLVEVRSLGNMYQDSRHGRAMPGAQLRQQWKARRHSLSDHSSLSRCKMKNRSGDPRCSWFLVDSCGLAELNRIILYRIVSDHRWLQSFALFTLSYNRKNMSICPYVHMSICPYVHMFICQCVIWRVKKLQHSPFKCQCLKLHSSG